MTASTFAAVVLEGGRVTQTLTATGTTAADRMRDLLTKVDVGTSVRVAVSAPGSTARAATATRHWHDRAEFTRDAHTLTRSIPASTYPMAAFDTAALTTGTAPAVVATLPRATVDEMLTLTPAHTHLTATPLCMSALDGVTLLVDDASAWLTLGSAAHLHEVAPLLVGGVAKLDVRLGQGQTVGATRLGAALRSRPEDHRRVDPEAVTELRAYATSLAGQVDEQLRAWRLAGRAVPAEVTSIGPVSTSPAVQAALEERGLRATPSPVVERGLASTAPNERARFAVAYLAALTYNRDRPQEVAATARLVHAAQRLAGSGDRRRARRTLTACAAIVLAGLALPVLAGAGAALVARVQLNSHIATFAERSGANPQDVRDILDNGHLGQAVPSATWTAIEQLSSPVAAVHADGTHTTLEFEHVESASALIASLETVGLQVTGTHRSGDHLSVDVATPKEAE